MTFDREDVYYTLSAATTANELFALLCDHATALGFEYCCYGLRMPIPISQRPLHIYNTYPEGWMDRYLGEGYLRCDPVVKLGPQTPTPLLWSEELFRGAKTMWDEAKSVGLRYGMSQSSWGTHGTLSVLSLARSEEIITPAENDMLTGQLVRLANVTHVAMLRFLGCSLEREGCATLTAREHEVLCWSGEGKTAYEVGRILNISPNTVNFHINNILTKLSATNKIQAVVKAVALGLID
jgi:LuxR family quorum-sensing system transcriptional regulator SolR